MSFKDKPIKYDDFKRALERFAYERAEQAKKSGSEWHKRDCVVLDRLLLLFDAGKVEITQALRTASSRLNRG